MHENDSETVLCNARVAAGKEILYQIPSTSDRKLNITLNDYNSSKREFNIVTGCFSFSTANGFKDFKDVLATIEMTHPGSPISSLGVPASLVANVTRKKTRNYLASNTNMGRRIRQQIEIIAATVLQKWFRCLEQLGLLGSRKKGATTIQCIYRSHCVRESLKKRKKNKKRWYALKNRLEKRNKAAKAIQQSHLRLRYIRQI